MVVKKSLPFTHTMEPIIEIWVKPEQRPMTFGNRIFQIFAFFT